MIDVSSLNGVVSHDWVLQLGKSGDILWTSSQVEDFLKYKQEEILGKKITDLVAEEDVNTISALLDELFKSGVEHRSVIVRFIDRDKKSAPLKVTLLPIKKPTGEVEYCYGVCAKAPIGIIEDFPDKQKTIKQYALENLKELIFIVDEDKRVVWGNKALCEIVGKKVEDLVGMFCYDVVWCDECARRQCVVDALKESGRCENLVITTPDNKHWLCTAVPLPNERSGKKLFAEVRVEISWVDWLEEQYNKVKVALERQQLFTEAILATIPMPVFYTDVEGRYLGCNKSFEDVLGISAENIKGKTVNQIWEGKLADDYYRSDLDVIRSGGTETKFVQVTDSSGKEHQMIMSKGVYKNENGKVWGLIGVLNDITEQKKAQEERLKAEIEVMQAQRLESLGMMAAGVAHDFNNALTVILGNIDIAMSELPSHLPTRDYLADARAMCLKAADLCRQMLTFTGKRPFSKQQLNLNSVIQEMNQLLSAAISKKLYIQYRFTEPLPLIEADPSQIKQIIMNLVVNASEAMGDKPGVITITTGWMRCDQSYLQTILPACRIGVEKPPKQGAYVFIEVSDTGCGMDVELQKRIFDPFFSTKFVGRGLGLSAVLGIVRAHNGGIKVYSELGKGSTFKVLFPVNGSAPRSKEAQKPDVQKREGYILVVDDEEGIRYVAKRAIEKLGFTVLTAANGREAIEIFKQLHKEILCVFLDLTMPGMDGEQAYRELRLINPAVKVVLCSGYSEEQALERFKGKGLVGFLQKPYDVTTIRKKALEVVSMDKTESGDKIGNAN